MCVGDAFTHIGRIECCLGTGERRRGPDDLSINTLLATVPLRSVIQGRHSEKANQVSADLIGAGVLPPLGVAMRHRRGGVLVRDKDHRIPAWLVDVAIKVGFAEPRQGLGEDP